MTLQLTDQQLRYLRLRSQGLIDTPKPQSLAKLVAHLVGIQAQYPKEAISTFPLLDPPTTIHIVSPDSDILLTWAFRGTMHFITKADFGWLFPFLGDLFIQKSQRRYRELGLTEDIRVQAGKILHETLLKNGEMTRPQLAEVLAAQHIPIEGQAIAHLVRYAALKGLICYGDYIAKEMTYIVLPDDVVMNLKIEESEILETLALRYLTAYAPATIQDFATWAGIHIPQARQGIEAIQPEVAEWDGKTHYLRPEQAEWLPQMDSKPDFKFLPPYDAYLLGYQSRDFMIAPEYARHVHPGGGVIYPCVILNGWAVGTWKRKWHKEKLTVEVNLFERLAQEIHEILEEEAQKIGLGEPVEIIIRELRP